MYVKRYTADDEMPGCGHCDNVSEDFDCCGSCGPDHGWAGYVRTEEKGVRTLPMMDGEAVSSRMSVVF